MKREAVIDRSGVTERLRKLFDEGNSLVRDTLDRLAVQFKRKDPEFYMKYKAAGLVGNRKATKHEALGEASAAEAKA